MTGSALVAAPSRAGGPTEPILGYAVYAGSLPALVEDIVAQTMRSPQPAGRWLACLNPHSYAEARQEPRFHAALSAAGWLIPDGVGIVLASRLLGGRIRRRVCGPDLFVELSAAMDRRGPFSALFIGSTEATLAALARRYADQHPNARRIATFSPPFRAEFTADDVAAMKAVIREHQPDLLWVGLTAPKQEILLAQFAADEPAFRFAAGIGAAFDFYVGNVRRAPAFFQRLGLEWLPRLLQQPRRLWRRTFVSAPLFLWHVLVRGVLQRQDAGRPGDRG